MNKFYVRMLLLAAVLAILPGCGSIDIYATRAAQMNDPEPPRLEVVNLSDQPVIIVHLSKHCGWGNQAGMLWVEEAITGHAVWEVSEFMRSGSTHKFIPPPTVLKPGTYMVFLRAEEETVAAGNFDVR